MGNLSDRISGAAIRIGMAPSRALAFLDGVYEKNAKGLTAATGVSMAMNFMWMAAYATDDDIFDKAGSMMNTIYRSIAGIASVTAGCIAAVCIYLMLFSKNQNTVQESIQWLKRIFICWLAIMLMATILRFVTNGLGVNSITDINNIGPTE